MTSDQSIHTPAHKESLAKVQAFVVDRAEALGAPASLSMKLELVVEEALINIVSYAYPDGDGEVETTCGLDDQGRFFIRFVDGGQPFDPTVQQAPDLSEDMEHRKIGGLGIFLVDKMSDEIIYRRHADTNEFTMFFGLTG